MEASSENESENETYSNTHRFLLQLIISEKVILESTLIEKLKDFDKNFKNQQLLDFIKEINNQLHFMFMEIKQIIWEEDGKVYFTFANTRPDQQAQNATSRTPNEINFFKEILKTIAESKKGSIGSNEATNLGKTHSLPADKSMELIKSFCEEFWLDMQNGILSLGPRTFGELRPFLESLEGPEHCAICKELTVRSEKCPNSQCETVLHKQCKTKLFSSTKNSKCPSCKTPWKSD